MDSIVRTQQIEAELSRARIEPRPHKAGRLRMWNRRVTGESRAVVVRSRVQGALEILHAPDVRRKWIAKAIGQAAERQLQALGCLPWIARDDVPTVVRIDPDQFG